MQIPVSWCHYAAVVEMCLYGSVAALYEWISISSSHTLSGVLCSGRPGPGTQIKAAFVCSGEQVTIWACLPCVCVCVRKKQRDRIDWSAYLCHKNRCGFSTASYSQHTHLRSTKRKVNCDFQSVILQANRQHYKHTLSESTSVCFYPLKGH